MKIWKNSTAQGTYPLMFHGENIQERQTTVVAEEGAPPVTTPLPVQEHPDSRWPISFPALQLRRAL